MFLVLAEANTSAGAPAMIWVTRPELGPKLNTTLEPGWAASNCWPSLVNASCKEAAANTLTVPDSAGELDTGAEDAAGLLAEPHPASRRPEAATTATVRTLRRICCSKVLVCGCRFSGSRGARAGWRGQGWAGSSMTTLVDFTAAIAKTPGSSWSSSAASRLIRDTMRCCPAWISTWAMTVSRTTRVTSPTNRLRADSETTGWGSGRSANAASSVANRARTAPSMPRRPEPSVVAETRPLSAHRRTVSSLTPSRSAASRIRKIDTPELYPHLRLRDTFRLVFTERSAIHIRVCGDEPSPGRGGDRTGVHAPRHNLPAGPGSCGHSEPPICEVTCGNPLAPGSQVCQALSLPRVRRGLDVRVTGFVAAR